jgi:hypothetical protein
MFSIYALPIEKERWIGLARHISFKYNPIDNPAG